MAIKVLNITTDDYANFSHDNANALRSVGVNCIDVKLSPHLFGYESQSEIVDKDQMKAIISFVDIVQIHHSDERCLNIYNEVKMPFHKLIVYHTGSRYREYSRRFNAIFNSNVEMSFIALGEFAGLGAKNEKYIVGAVDVESAHKFNHEIRAPYKLGHYPSNCIVKGTSEILKMTSDIKEKIEFKALFSTGMVGYKRQLKRMSKCDIYIELFNTTLNGKEYGSWGITALEAAAMGKVVVTQNLNARVYQEAYGYCPLVICNTEEKFIDNVTNLLNMDSTNLSLLQTETYNWVKNNHSYEATGNKLKNILNGL